VIGVSVPAEVAASCGLVTLTAEEFAWFTAFLSKITGIELRAGKESLVKGRLERRLRHYGLQSYGEYFHLLGRPEAPEETRLAIDLMTTNETYLFREPQHFELLPGLLDDARGKRARVWSAASSSGEEAYSIALTLADCLGERPWEVIGTDVSMRVLETARRGIFPIEAAERIPKRLLAEYCRKGRGDYEGFFTLAPELRSRVSFHRVNLTRKLENPGTFDVIFLRNVLIYFNAETKRQVVERLAATLRPGGSLVIGHAETLTGLGTTLRAVRPSIYRSAP
jgi:chemotaxis protein methyltransferase CheR